MFGEGRGLDAGWWIRRWPQAASVSVGDRPAPCGRAWPSDLPSSGPSPASSPNPAESANWSWGVAAAGEAAAATITIPTVVGGAAAIGPAILGGALGGISAYAWQNTDNGTESSSCNDANSGGSSSGGRYYVNDRGGFSFSDHALEQIEDRNISASSVHDALDEGEEFAYKDLKSGQGRIGYYDPTTKTFVGSTRRGRDDGD